MTATSLLGMVRMNEDKVLSVTTVDAGLTVQLVNCCPLAGASAVMIICSPAAYSPEPLPPRTWRV